MQSKLITSQIIFPQTGVKDHILKPFYQTTQKSEPDTYHLMKTRRRSINLPMLLILDNQTN